MKRVHRAISAVVATAAAGSLLLAGGGSAAAEQTSQATTSTMTVERVTGASDLVADATSVTGGLEFLTRGDGQQSVITVPTDSTGRIHGTGTAGEFSLGMPEQNKVAGVKSANGTVIYPDSARSTDTAVQVTQDGAVRALITMKDQSAPRRHTFDLRLPDGVELQPDGTGGYLAVKSSTEGKVVVGRIDAPWAKDASGRPVATHYEIDNGALIQTVEPDEETTFPVVADPKITFGWNIYINYSKQEVKKLYSKVTYLGASASICSIGGLAGIPCAAITFATATKIKNTWEYAKNHGRCIEVKIGYTGLFSGIKHYSC